MEAAAELDLTQDSNTRLPSGRMMSTVTSYHNVFSVDGIGDMSARFVLASSLCWASASETLLELRLELFQP